MVEGGVTPHPEASCRDCSSLQSGLWAPEKVNKVPATDFWKFLAEVSVGARLGAGNKAAYPRVSERGFLGQIDGEQRLW